MPAVQSSTENLLCAMKFRKSKIYKENRLQILLAWHQNKTMYFFFFNYHDGHIINFRQVRLYGVFKSFLNLSHSRLLAVIRFSNISNCSCFDGWKMMTKIGKWRKLENRIPIECALTPLGSYSLILRHFMAMGEELP